MIAAQVDRLMQAFGFSHADLISNRHGELTAAQRERLGMSAFFGAAWVLARLHARNLTRHRFTVAEGQARTRSRKYYRYGREVYTYELWIGRRKFNLLSQEELSAFEDGMTYRVYYVPYAPLHIILSAEALDFPSV